PGGRVTRVEEGLDDGGQGCAEGPGSALSERGRSIHRPGELLAGAVSGLVGVGAALPERPLEPLQAVTHDARLRAEVLGGAGDEAGEGRSEEHTSELQSRFDLVCRLL